MPKYILFIKANKDSETGRMPTTEEFAEMGAYNQKLIDAGILVTCDGLLASKEGARVTFSADPVAKPPVASKGPFPVNEVVAGYWIVTVPNLDKAVEWVKKCPIKDEGTVIEVRKIADECDFGPELTPELKEMEEKQRQELEKRAAAE
jgi:hypothetical protein